MNTPQNPQIELPDEAGLMVLPNAVLIPNALLPLHIFEEQYREMLRWSLERDRLFCIAMRRPDAGDEDRANFLPIGGIGLVRACVGAEDGTSNLILQGLARVQIGPLIQDDPFRIARIGQFETHCPNPVQAEALGVKVLELCDKMHEQGFDLPPKLVEKLRHVGSSELLADIVAQTFLRDPLQQQRVMEEASISQRMRLLIRYLKAGMTV